MSENVKIKEIATLFLKLGVIGFGGPAAHIALMHEEVVKKRNWFSEQQFLDLVGATNLIPGPNSTELAIHIGYDKGGWKGLLVAGLCFILPAVFITGIFAWLYSTYGSLPNVQPYIYGIKPAIIAIIIGAVYPLAIKSLKTNLLIGISILVLVLALLGVNELTLLFGAGFLALAIAYYKNKESQKLGFLFPLSASKIAITGLTSALNVKLFWIFLKIGAILYGSGYVLFAFLDAELVDTGLLNRQQLIDAIAVGQFTPGPVFSAVTFIGYQINGWNGAALSTLAIFLPSFVFVALLHYFISKLRSSVIFSSFLDAVNSASIAIILAVCFTMGKEVLVDWKTFLIAILSGLVVFKFKKVNSAFVVLGGALLGYMLY